MEISIRRNGRYTEVIIKDGGTEIRSGLLDAKEIKPIVHQFESAVDEMCEYLEQQP